MNDLLNRVLSKVALSEELYNGSPCWIWKGAKIRGYGHIHKDRKALRTHRITYEAMVSPVPPGLVLDHLCRNRACCNPKHLEAVTNKVNVLRGTAMSAIHSKKTHCPRGHPLSGENLHIRPNGARRCQECHRMQRNESKERVRKRKQTN